MKSIIINEETKDFVRLEISGIVSLQDIQSIHDCGLEILQWYSPSINLSCSNISWGTLFLLAKKMPNFNGINIQVSQG